MISCATFGSLVPNRHGSTDEYRYGFQGQENDNEIKGEGNSLNFAFRMHDPRVGRFFSMDPLSRQYSFLTPYQFSSNSTISLIELEGKEGTYNEMLAEEFNLKSIWDNAVDGLTNIQAIVGEYMIPDEIEGRAIYNILMTFNSYKDIVVPDEVTFEQLGKSFKIRKENRQFLILPEEGILSDLKDLTISTLDLLSIFPTKGSGVFMAIKTGVATNGAISSILRSLKVSSRSKEILDTFVDIQGSGKFSVVEAEGMAIFEETFQTTVRSIDKVTDVNKAGDFIVTSGKFANKSVDLVSAVNNSGFKMDKFVKSIDKHYLKKGVDYINIDIRKLNEAQKKLIKDHVKNQSKQNIERTIITE